MTVSQRGISIISSYLSKHSVFFIFEVCLGTLTFKWTGLQQRTTVCLHLKPPHITRNHKAHDIQYVFNTLSLNGAVGPGRCLIEKLLNAENRSLETAVCIPRASHLTLHKVDRNRYITTILYRINNLVGRFKLHFMSPFGYRSV